MNPMDEFYVATKEFIDDFRVDGKRLIAGEVIGVLEFIKHDLIVEQNKAHDEEAP